MTPILVFDIETVPDAAGLRKLWDLGPTVSDAAVVELASQRRRQATGNDFLPAHTHRVVAISCALRSDEGVRVWSLGSSADSEADIVKRFFDGIEKYTPQLVSWNGSGFDLPVLHYRALIHGIAGCCYWDLGDNDREFKFNNYLSRFHTRHTDLMDVLAGYQNRAWAPLDEMAQLCGLLTFLSKLARTDGTQLVFFAGIDEARFKRQVVPGDVLHLSADLERAVRSIGRFRCTAMVDGQLVCEALLLAAVRDVPPAVPIPGIE